MSADTATKRRQLEYVREDGSSGILVGRFAWALEELIKAGSRGVTPLERPAPRWSHYVHILRKEHTLHIETIEERHEGEFAGVHGRYVLREHIKLIPENAKPTAADTESASNPMATNGELGRLLDHE